MPEAPVELRVRIGGEAGFGIKAAGQTLARSFAGAGLETFDLTEYPSLIRGGHNNYLLRVSPEPVYSHVEPVDILVCLNRETLDLHHQELLDGGAVIFDPDDFDASAVPERLRAVPVPLMAFAREAGG
jgi:2-oxoglutarate ferredoxin oxidoreductase subunit alpha